MNQKKQRRALPTNLKTMPSTWSPKMVTAAWRLEGSWVLKATDDEVGTMWS
jgi:hypothetical protein